MVAVWSEADYDPFDDVASGPRSGDEHPVSTVPRDVIAGSRHGLTDEIVRPGNRQPLAAISQGRRIVYRADIVGQDRVVAAGYVDPVAAEQGDDQALDGRVIRLDHQPGRRTPRPVPFSSTSGTPVKPGSVVPSIVTGCVIAGRAESRLIVWTPDAPRLNVIRFAWAVSVFELEIARRRVLAAVGGAVHDVSRKQLTRFERLDGRASSPAACEARRVVAGKPCSRSHS